MIISSSSIETLDLSILNNLPSKILQKSFGGVNDIVTFSIFDLNGNLLLTDNNFKEYEKIYSEEREPTIKALNIDYEKVLREYGYLYGKYRVVFSFHRWYFAPSNLFPFQITEISPTRTELRFKSSLLDSDNVTNEIYKLQNDLLASAYIRDINLIFPNGVSFLLINAAVDLDSEGSFLAKVYNPLPSNIGSDFKIAEEIINPIEVIIDLGDRINQDNSIDLGNPNFDLYKIPPSSTSNDITYDNIQGSNSSSFNELNQFIYSNPPTDLDFTNNDTPSGYHFENFIHFGSAVERLNAFTEKLFLIESYNISSSILDTITGDVSSSPVVVDEKKYWEDKKLEIIRSFDPYERFLYYESNSYAWPKVDNTRPYTNASVNSIQAISWLGYEFEEYPGVYSEGQLKEAAAFDDQNVHNLINTIPEFITSNPANASYLKYVNLIGHHFDSIWAYIDSITDVLEADSALQYGISKNLVKDALTQLGIPQFDQFENSNMYEYFLGSTKDGIYQYQPFESGSITMISASNAGSIPKGDITKEIWKRLYHNAPYLLKTKGTERGLKALITCYGIPETILNIKEYGGPTTDKSGFRTFSYQKESKMITGTTQGVILHEDVPNDTKTIQLRFLPTYGSNTQYDIITGYDYSGGLPGDNDFSIGISQSLNPNLLNSESFAHLVITSGSAGTGNAPIAIASSSLAPLFNGDVWNLSIILDSGSSNTITAYATNTTFHKNTYAISCSLDLTNLFEGASNNTILAIGNSTVTNNPILASTILGPFSGSIQEYRAWFEKLDIGTIITQSLSPFNYNGNTISSSYESLYLRVPLGSDNKNYIGNLSVNNAPNPSYHSLYNVDIDPDPELTYITELHHLTTPDTVGSSMVSDKVRIENSIFNDTWLAHDQSIEISSLDTQPLDYSDLGVFFSPTFEVNEDIIYTLGGFRLDDYIGSPTNYGLDNYPNLNELKKIYRNKIEKRYNVFDYIRTIQFFDHTLFRYIENFTPAKANLKTGLVIEPHYLERAKIPNSIPKVENKDEYVLEYTPSSSISSTNIEIPNIEINVTNYLVEGSYGDAVGNVAQVNKLSKKLFLI